MSAASTPDPSAFKKSSVRSQEPAKGLKRFTPITLRRKGDSLQVQLHWKRLFLFLVVTGLTTWFSLASSAFLFLKYKRGFYEVKFTDMLLLPARWDEYQKARGDFLIKKAQEDLKEQKYREAFNGLRLGLIKSPTNKEGRLLLTQFYGLWKRPDLGRQTLLDGFRYFKDDADYLKILFSFLLQQQEDKQVIAFYKELLETDKTVNPRNQLVAMAGASACYFRGNYDEAETILRDYRLENVREGRLLTARINWDRGAKDQALEILRALANESPGDVEIYSQTIAYLREAGRDNEARRESFLRSLANPSDARARIDQLYANHREGDTVSVKANTEDIYRDFSNDANVLLALADVAANTGEPALARRIYDHTKAMNLNWEGAALMAVEANIVAKKYQSALELVRQFLKDDQSWGKRYYTVFNGLQAIAHYGLGDADAAQLFLNNFLTQTNVRADNLMAVSRRLLVVGAKTQARQVLEQAVQTDALNQAALTGLVQLDLELNNTPPLAANLRKLLTMRKPSQDILRTAYGKLGSDLFLFSPDRSSLLQDLRAAIKDQPANS